ncbi:hypothetical protein SFHH103_psfHH103d_63 (plasmid) [Sinorhizobium fredii HH103]|uniref:Uncharacterized protein n=1 Tax=Sinorhizobium fredii (strain USDA 257) TaxID=1185652 RepID=I3XGY4_SINF2|nr:hypothetical protein USDA257_p04250 [Sinorhizobium fredii USDA 257]CCE99236.1 hypothetical protein SFHH103_04766 [Sinorhizobium fredii HH103]CEO91260.1 hypothetical protein SFHH103_psfHH103d_63 [Sinorhizobium fredii HH103]
MKRATAGRRDSFAIGEALNHANFVIVSASASCRDRQLINFGAVA